MSTIHIMNNSYNQGKVLHVHLNNSGLNLWHRKEGDVIRRRVGIFAKNA